MKLIFMGSGSFAVPSLKAIIDSPHHDVTALITQPDKPAGRGHRLRLPPTKRIAIDHSIEVHQPAKVRAPESVELIERLEPECIVVAAYGQIIPKTILDIPARGIINVHASLLPRYRGAAPIQWAIARGESRTGVTTMLMDEGLDTGAILLQRDVAIADGETYGSLEPKLAELGAELLLETLAAWGAGTLTPIPQDDGQATLAPRIKKTDAAIAWTEPSETIARRVRAFDPWPTAFTTLSGAPLKIWKARPLPGRDDHGSQPGEIVAVRDDGLDIACGGGSHLLVEELQLAGKSRLRAAEFARGRRLHPGDRLGG